MSEKAGRPSKETPEVVTKLVAAFSMGYNSTEAIFYAGISRETFYRWLSDKPAFRDKIEQAKSGLNMKAKELIVDSLGKGDLNTAKWWLERKARAEFGRADSDKGQELPSEYVELQHSMQASLESLEELICMRYRELLFLQREQQAKGLLVNSKAKTRMDELLEMPDSKLADYIQLEIYATGNDKANVKRWVDERQSLRSDIKKVAREAHVS